MTAFAAPGARWWKVDFHAHSPASFDFGAEHGCQAEDSTSFSDWLLTYMRSGIDAIVVTDHNTHEGIDKARATYHELKNAMHGDFREIKIFTGAEITTNGGVHLLAVFDIDTDSEVINGILHSCSYRGTRGSSDGVTEAPFADVVRLIHEKQGLAIPAHVDSNSGLFASIRGKSLVAALENSPIIAMEVPHSSQVRNQTFDDSGLRWASVLGSDAHYLDDAACPPGVESKYPGSHFTWVKMASVNLSGLRLALHDEQTSIRRSDVFVGDPNEPMFSTVQSVSITHNSNGEEPARQEYKFGPWLNSVIGGRGTGKSTLVEVSRVALDRFAELPVKLQKDLSRFDPNGRRSDDPFWSNPTAVQMHYCKNGRLFRINWSSDKPEGHWVEAKNELGNWELSPGNIQERFPVRIYSQKQIYEIALDPSALLKLIDAAPEVGFASWKIAHAELVDDYKTLRSDITTLKKLVAQEGDLLGRREDVQHKLDQIQELTQSGALPELREHENQLRMAAAWEVQAVQLQDQAEQLSAGFEEFSGGLKPSFSISGVLDESLSAGFESRLDGVRRAGESVQGARTILAESRHAWESALADSSFQQKVDALRLTITQQGASFENAGQDLLVTDTEVVEAELTSIEAELSFAPDLMVQIANIDLKLEKVSAAKLAVRSKEVESKAALKKVYDSRRALFSKRRDFISKVSKRTADLNIVVVEQGDLQSLDYEVRRLLARDSGFEKNLATLLDNVPEPSHNGYLPRIEKLKKDLTAIVGPDADDGFMVQSGIHKRFSEHLRSLPEETVQAVQTWFPEDSLKVSYRPESSKEFRPVAQGSPGQKTAALLSLILSVGDEPLILDQPEDDLDNQLIYRLVVKTLRDIKLRRQVIVVTHNANIVVNGDSEHVMVLGHGHSDGTVMASGFLQDPELREAICLIMEGGYEAFSARYHRLGVSV